VLPVRNRIQTVMDVKEVQRVQTNADVHVVFQFLKVILHCLLAVRRELPVLETLPCLDVVDTPFNERAL
jgi:hypothetical protein